MTAPDRLGKYPIRRELGRGAMGVVYEGYDPVIERAVAIKVLRLDEANPELANELRMRFRREAQAAGRLGHPGIVAVYEYGEDAAADSAFIVMELVRGRDLKSLFSTGRRFTLEETGRLMADLLAALQHAHERGVVHRDIKPGNIILLDGGGAKIADFGIAKLDTSELTQLGSVLGTVSYMAPEQLTGAVVDGRGDLYSCGVILYQLLTGERPFTGSPAAVMHKVLHENPTPPSQHVPALPRALDQVVLTAMAKAPAERYSNAIAFATALHAALDGAKAAAAAAAADTDATVVRAPAVATPPSRRRPIVGAAVGIALVVAAGAVAYRVLGPHSGSELDVAVQAPATRGVPLAAAPAPEASTTPPTPSPDALAGTVAAATASPAPAPSASPLATGPAPSPAASPAVVGVPSTPAASARSATSKPALPKATQEPVARTTAAPPATPTVPIRNPAQTSIPPDAKIAMAPGAATPPVVAAAVVGPPSRPALRSPDPVPSAAPVPAAAASGSRLPTNAAADARPTSGPRDGLRSGANPTAPLPDAFGGRVEARIAPTESARPAGAKPGAPAAAAAPPASSPASAGIARTTPIECVDEARRGNARCQVVLGDLYRNGRGVPRDPAEAARWYRKAAEQRSDAGQYELGLLYESGLGVVKDPVEAVGWFRKAAAQGHARAQNKLGAAYENGSAGPRNPVLAVEWYRKAADQNLPSGQYNLGRSYLAGRGVFKDPAKGGALVQAAADQGEPNAMVLLAGLYASGDGKPRDREQATRLYRDALARAGLNDQNRQIAMRALASAR